jgi:hypothetical protein
VFFWFWIVVTVLAVPPIAFGLIFAVLYLCVPRKYICGLEPPARLRARQSMWWRPW